MSSPFDEPSGVTGLAMLNPEVPHAVLELQFSDFNRAIYASETELAKWEGYGALACHQNAKGCNSHNYGPSYFVTRFVTGPQP